MESMGVMEAVQLKDTHAYIQRHRQTYSYADRAFFADVVTSQLILAKVEMYTNPHLCGVS